MTKNSDKTTDNLEIDGLVQDCIDSIVSTLELL